MAQVSYGTITISDLTDGASIWTTTVAPTTPNYTFTISNLQGSESTPKIGDIILYDTYRYTITTVNNLTVLANYRQSLQGTEGRGVESIETKFINWNTNTESNAPTTSNTWYEEPPVFNSQYPYYYVWVRTIYTDHINPTDEIYLDNSVSYALNKTTEIDALNAQAKYFWWDRDGAHIASGLTSADSNDNIQQSQPASYGFNALTAPGFLKLRYEDVDYVQLTTNSLTFYNGIHILNITSNPTSSTGTIGGFAYTYRMSISTIKTQSGSNTILVGDALRRLYLSSNKYEVDYFYVGYISSSYAYLTKVSNIQGKKAVELNTESLTFYKPLAYNSSNELTVAAQLNANGLNITDGTIQLGTGGSSGTSSGNITLSNVDFTRSINGTSRNNLRLAIGQYFGVKNDGTLYANGAVISGQITVTSGSNLSAGLGDYSTTSETQSYVTGLGYQTSSQVNSIIEGKGYQTASDVNGAINTATSGLATKGDAVYRTQRIYYRKTSNSAPNGNTTWLTSSTSGTGYGNWSLSIPQLTSGTTKYPYLYTAIQTQTITQYNGGSGTACSCSAVLLDNTTTIIDGGAIIAGSVTANEITGSKLSAIYADMGNITAGNITKGYNSINFDNTPATLEFKNASRWDSATQGIRYNSDGLEIKGAVTATSLTLGNGVTIPASTGISGLSTVATTGSYNDLTNKPTIPSLTGYIYQNGTIGTTPADGATGFVVSNTGLLQASNAVIYGSLYASKGYIGGWQIGTDGNKSLHNGNANTSPTPGEGIIILSKGITGPSTATGVLPANQNWAITAGNQFGVTTDGTLYAANARISGTITIGGIGSNIYTADEINNNIKAIKDELYGIITYEYISEGVTYVVYSETDEDGNTIYYYTINSGTEDAPIEERYEVDEVDLVHNEDNTLKEVIKGAIAEQFEALDIETENLNSKYNELSNKEDLSLISKGYASIANDTLTLFKQDSEGEIVSALELTSAGIDLKAEGVLVATMRNDNGIGIMRATNMEQTFVKMIQSDGVELFQWIAQSNGHLSLKKM